MRKCEYFLYTRRAFLRKNAEVLASGIGLALSVNASATVKLAPSELRPLGAGPMRALDLSKYLGPSGASS